ncbi:hypothetical protein IFR04_004293 [Cadophora malorum]|uniref:Uncharacterized protein n=1 Tax=Cadophora malorum TaxID=108018 RepID=A0A8H7WCX0_9HELO|nr:hypothetical protein IFR04_004293 [Cadophora malorum]
MSDGMYRRTEEPQRTDDPRADAEWKADSALGNLAHGADSQGSEVDRSTKAAPLPDGAFKDNDRVIGGEGSRGIKGWTGDGKGAVNPDEYIPKKVEKVTK